MIWDRSFSGQAAYILGYEVQCIRIYHYQAVIDCQCLSFSSVNVRVSVYTSEYMHTERAVKLVLKSSAFYFQLRYDQKLRQDLECPRSLLKFLHCMFLNAHHIYSIIYLKCQRENHHYNCDEQMYKYMHLKPQATCEQKMQRTTLWAWQGKQRKYTKNKIKQKTKY